MRVSWYGDTGVAVFSIWQGGRCSGTFRLPADELARLVETLRLGPEDQPPEGQLFDDQAFDGEPAARQPVGGLPEEPDHRPGRRRRAEPDDYLGEPDSGAAAPRYLAPPAARDRPAADPLGLDYRGPETAGYRASGRPGDGTGYRGGDHADYPSGEPWARADSGAHSRPGGPAGGAAGWPADYPEHESQPYADGRPYSAGRPYPDESAHAGEPYGDDPSYGDGSYSDGEGYPDGELYAEDPPYRRGRPYVASQPRDDGGPYGDSRPYRASPPYAYEDDDRLPYNGTPPAPYQDPRLATESADGRSPNGTARHAH
jgi:hypothetical protein